MKNNDSKKGKRILIYFAAGFSILAGAALFILAILMITYEPGGPIFSNAELDFLANPFFLQIIQGIGWIMLAMPIPVVAFGIVLLIKKDSKQVLFALTIVTGVVLATLLMIFGIGQFGGYQIAPGIERINVITDLMMMGDMRGYVFYIALLSGLTASILLIVALYKRFKKDKLSSTPLPRYNAEERNGKE